MGIGDKTVSASSPQRGEARWAAALQEVVARGAAVHAVPPSNLPPLGGGNGPVHTAMDHHKGCSSSEIA